MGDKCGIILDKRLEQYNTPYNIYHYPNSIKIVRFLNRGVLVKAKVVDNETLENTDLGKIKGNLVNKFKKGLSLSCFYSLMIFNTMTKVI